MKNRKINTIVAFAVMMALVILLVTGCASTGPEQDTQPTPEPQDGKPQSGGIDVVSDLPDGSILLFQNDEGSAKLIKDMNEGHVPASCMVMYDQMGSRPFVNVKDPEVITELYNRLTQITVGEQSDMSITDCYHSIYFKLQDGTSVGYSFEGTGLLTWGYDNYEVSGSGSLWSLVQQLQDEYMELPEYDIKVKSGSELIEYCPAKARENDVIVIYLDRETEGVFQVLIDGEDIGEFVDATKYRFEMPAHKIKIDVSLSNE